MALQNYQGQLYDSWQNDLGRGLSSLPTASMQLGQSMGYTNVKGLGLARAIQPSSGAQHPVPVANGQDYFNNVSSGGVSGTLQPYINRQTEQAGKALNGGLLNFQPQQLQSGNAGGQPIQTQAPQFDLQSALLNKQFGNRAWMG